jgi:hypothetical protein
MLRSNIRTNIGISTTFFVNELEILRDFYGYSNQLCCAGMLITNTGTEVSDSFGSVATHYHRDRL